MTDSPKSADSSDSFANDLERAAQGDQAAKNRLWENHYELLRECATRWLENNWRRREGAMAISLGGTDIVSAAYDRLRDRTAAMKGGKTLFFRCFYNELLRIAVDHYRRALHHRGNGKIGRITLPPDLAANRDDVDFEAVYALLNELTERYPREGQVALLKVLENRQAQDNPGAYRELTNSEVAEMLGWSLRTVEADWAFAKAWIMRRLTR